MRNRLFGADLLVHEPYRFVERRPRPRRDDRREDHRDAADRIPRIPRAAKQPPERPAA